MTLTKEIRNQRITFRISPTEKKYLEEQAAKAHMSVSSYLIKLSENKRIIVAEKVPDLYIEIRRIGVNINQIAHMANSQKYVTEPQMRETIRLLQDVKENMEKIVQEVERKEEVSYYDLEERVSRLERNFSRTYGRLEKFLSLLEKFFKDKKT